MLNLHTSYLLEADAKILLDRALLGKTVNAFGIDGAGQYGTSYTAKHFEVESLTASVDMYSDVNEPFVYVCIRLKGYNNADNGDIVTDNNLKISINSLLDAQGIDINCWEWADIKLQFSTSVTIRMNLVELLQW